jgi:xanthine/CO dehydrogenase XdhC/CoxF family maturation factor
MTEMTRLLAHWQRLVAAGEHAVLATVVKVEGSAYRRPGARMLVDADGRNTGTLSGGCLEEHVMRRAWWLTAGQGARVVRYDTRADEDAQWSFGLGCDGAVHVLLERLDGRAGAPVLDVLAQARTRMHAAGSAVVIAAHGVAVPVGARLVLDAGGQVTGTLGEVALTDRVSADLRAALARGRSAQAQYPVGAGMVEVFLECMAPPLRLVIFGAGHDAVPLVHFAKRLGWHVTVADGRAHFARPQRFPEADAVCVVQADDPLASCRVDARSAVVVMTHSLTQDRELLRHLLPLDLAYLGLLGPQSRTARLLDELAVADAETVADGRARLHAPVGLDIGADNAEEVALAIVAEIRAVRAGREGGMARLRQEPLHVRDAALVGGRLGSARAVA